jgi:hypothetical protein
MRWVRHVEGIEQRRGAYRILEKKPDKSRALESLRHRWDNNIQMNL